VPAGAILGALLLSVMIYNSFKIEVRTGEQAVLIRKAGLDLEPEMELAPPPKDGKSYYKGVQTSPNKGVLTEGRYFYNPFYWDWEILPQFVVTNGKIGIRISLQGDELPTGQVLAEPGQKGILREVLRPGRYPYNPYAEKIEEHDPVIVPAGYRGVVTLLAGRDPKDPNVILVGEGERGVQKRTLEPGLYYLNPYETRVYLVDCRSKRFNLGSDSGEMDFLSADGFVVTLDGAVEFRVIPDRAAEVFVLYNEDSNGDAIDEEIIAKVITPESRSLCRVGGSKLTGGQFINGDDREQFQRNMVKSLTENCEKQGIEIMAVAITSIQPPQQIATPVRAREVAKQELAQYNQERIQQLSEAQLKVQILLAEQKKRLVEGEQTVVEQTTKAEQDQSVAVTLAEQKWKVAETQLEAAKDKAAAMVAKAEAEADVIRFNNKAELAGLATRVQAFGGDGTALAQNLLIGKLAPAFRTILANSDGPLMELFGQFARPSEPGKAGASPPLAGPTSKPADPASESAPIPAFAPAPITSAEARP
jgi:regulator of protease activity HflC (stomatin/prohibitin superfamily)